MPQPMLMRPSPLPQLADAKACDSPVRSSHRHLRRRWIMGGKHKALLKQMDADADAALDSLDLWQFDPATVLWASLEVSFRELVCFSLKYDQGSLEYEQQRRQMMDWLDVVFCRCAKRPAAEWKVPKNELPLDVAREAVPTLQAYSEVRWVFPHAFRCRLSYDVSGSTATFKFRDDHALQRRGRMIAAERAAMDYAAPDSSDFYRLRPPREAPVRTDTASEDELEVADTPVHLGGHLWHCHVDTGALSVLLESCGVESPTQAALVDVGCGTGGVVEAARRMGIHAYGIDGDPMLPDRAKAWQNHPEWFLLHDFTHPLADLPTDWQGFSSCDESAFRIGWCVEFAEHVEEGYIPNYVPVLTQCDVVILTAATSERGHHHVHLEPETYWRGVLAGHGFRLDPDLTEAVRQGSTMQREFIRDGAMVFRAVR
ncbi:MAG: hypothetical protein GF320_00895 [Armatimonadia bacterium]|nr:hypothetical protein [Armatimonadia bacterium]